jgi:hypothetical protein
MDRDYLQDALMTFNGGNWYSWKKEDDNGNKIPNDQRMCYECIEIIKDGATMPTKAEVDAKIQELKDAEADRETKKASAKEKLLALGLTEEEIKLTFGV